MLDVCREVSFPFINPRRMHPRVISGYVKSSAPSPSRLILYGLHYSCFPLSERSFDDAVDDVRRDGRERRDGTERGQDGAFADLTKQFKRLSCPSMALKGLAEKNSNNGNALSRMDRDNSEQMICILFRKVSCYSRNGASLTHSYKCSRDCVTLLFLLVLSYKARICT